MRRCHVPVSQIATAARSKRRSASGQLVRIGACVNRLAARNMPASACNARDTHDYRGIPVPRRGGPFDPWQEACNSRGKVVLVASAIAVTNAGGPRAPAKNPEEFPCPNCIPFRPNLPPKREFGPTTMRVCTKNPCAMPTASGARRQAPGLDQAVHPGQGRLLRPPTICTSAGIEDGALNVSANCLDRHLADARRQDRDHLGRRRSRRVARASATANCMPRSASSPMRCKHLGVEQGRPRDDLPADDSRSRGGDAGLRAHRRDPLGGVRRVLAGFAGRPHRRLRLQAGHHRRRGPARRQDGSRSRPMSTPRSNAAARSSVETVLVVRRTGGAVAMQAPRDRWYHDLMDGQSQRTARPSRWTPRIRCSSCTPPARPASPRACCTPPAATWSMPATPTNACSTCARTTSTGARPTSAGSPATATSSTARWPTARTTLMFEGVPNYPDAGRFWQVVDKHKVTPVLHRADGDPRADARRRRAGEEDLPRKSLRAARHGRRADQSGSLGVVPPRGRRRAAARSSTPGGRPRPAAS